MSFQDPARILVASGLKLRELRRGLQARALELADREFNNGVSPAGDKERGRERARLLSLDRDSLTRMVRTSRVRSKKLSDYPYLSRVIAAFVDQLVQETGLNYRKLQAAFDRELTKAAIEATRAKGLRRPLDTGAGGAAKMLGVHRNLIPRILARTEVLRAEVN